MGGKFEVELELLNEDFDVFSSFFEETDFRPASMLLVGDREYEVFNPLRSEPRGDTISLWRRFQLSSPSRDLLR